MKKYRYQTITGTNLALLHGFGSVVTGLNTLGAQGWECCGMRNIEYDEVEYLLKQEYESGDNSGFYDDI